MEIVHTHHLDSIFGGLNYYNGSGTEDDPYIWIGVMYYGNKSGTDENPRSFSYDGEIKIVYYHNSNTILIYDSKTQKLISIIKECISWSDDFIRYWIKGDSIKRIFMTEHGRNCIDAHLIKNIVVSISRIGRTNIDYGLQRGFIIKLSDII
jgi:hypothetical protein